MRKKKEGRGRGRGKDKTTSTCRGVRHNLLLHWCINDEFISILEKYVPHESMLIFSLLREVHK